MSREAEVLLPEATNGEPGGCYTCADRIASRVRSAPGVDGVELLKSPMRIVYSYDSGSITPRDIQRLVRDEHDAAEERYVHHVLAIEGMDCADCSRTLERGVSRLDGVEHAAVNFGSARMVVELDQQTTDLDSVGRRVKELGYAVSLADEPHVGERRALLRLLTRRDNALALAAGVFTEVGIIMMLAGAAEVFSNASFAFAVIVGGLPLLRKGVRTARTTHSLDINLLMSLAVIGAAAIGDWLEAATVVFLFSLGEALEGYAMDRVRRSVRSLLSLAPATALVQDGDTEIERPVSEIGVGDLVVIRAGQRVPLDGVVLTGVSSVDQSSLTGESLPVSKETGDALFAGTMNGSGPLVMRVTRLASDSSVAKIIRLVEHAQGQRAPVQRIVDRFARVYTPAVIAGAAMVALVPPLLGGDWLEWFSRALVLLVISCPCALVLSTPISIVSALSAAAKHGILIKGGAILERAGAIDTVSFDKTGTLTTGRPRVTDVTPFDGRSSDALLSLAGTLERHSEHPLGRGIFEASQAANLSLDEVLDEQVVPGAGLTASVAGVSYRIGSRRLFSDDLPSQASTAVWTIEERGGTAVLVGDESGILGVIGLADVARTDAAQAVRELRQSGVDHFVMLSGDRSAAAYHVADEVGVDEVRAELLPEQKLAAIGELRGQGRVVAMVGDGVNDAPSLAAADVGIAMGVVGTDAAVETADIALMGDDLRGLAETISLGKRTSRIVVMNIGISIVTKLVFLVLAVLGEATLWMAIAADMGVSLLVIANGLRLLRWPNRPDGAGSSMAPIPGAVDRSSVPAPLAS